jgi:hypothetical protein
VNKLLVRLGREPVLIGAAVLATIDIAVPPVLVRAAVVAWIALFVRAFSSPKQAVNEAKEAGYNAAIADVSSLVPAVPPPPLPPSD